MIPVRGSSGSRADMHCHSTASQVAKLGIQRSIGLPECATPPEEVYELAKRRGMDFVTITDHDTIDGCLEIADRDDVFISEELTAWFSGEPPGGPRPLLRHRPRRSRVPPGPRARSRDRGRVPPRARAHLRARASVLRRRRAVAGASSPPPRRAVWCLGDPKRLPRSRAQHARRRVHRDPWRHRHRRLRRSRRRRHRANVHRDAARLDAGRVSRPRSRGPCLRPRRSGQRRQVGALGARARHPCVDGRPRDRPVRGPDRPLGGARDRREGGLRWQPAGRQGEGEPRRGRGAGGAARLARVGRAQLGPARADHADAGRRLQPPRPRPAGAANP